MSVYQKKISLMIICLISTILVGCGGGSSSSDDGPGETQASMEGDWHGTVRWETGVDWEVDLSLSRENNGNYSGSLQGSTSEGQELPPAEDVTGSVNGSDVSISLIKPQSCIKKMANSWEILMNIKFTPHCKHFVRNKPMVNLRIGSIIGHLFYPPAFATLG